MTTEGKRGASGKEHQGEYFSLTATAAVLARQSAVSKASVRRWVLQSQVDGGQRAGATSEEPAEIKARGGEPSAA